MKSALHITGQPVVDLWIESSEHDAHIVAELELIDPSDEPMRYSTNPGFFDPIFGSNGVIISTYGLRSLQHLDPMPENYFKQQTRKLAPVNTPIQVLVRMLPTDIVVPKDHSLRLTIAGTTSLGKSSSPSGAGSTIKILHDCDRTSALRFLMPTADAPLLNVREVGEEGPLKPELRTMGVSDGAGIAGSFVCETIDSPAAPPPTSVKQTLTPRATKPAVHSNETETKTEVSAEPQPPASTSSGDISDQMSLPSSRTPTQAKDVKLLAAVVIATATGGLCLVRYRRARSSPE